MLKLLAITAEGCLGIPGEESGFTADIINVTRDHYKRIGFQPPWIGYFVMSDGQNVGGCGFKYPPRDNKVEIAYFTFPEFEGKGHATRTAAAIVELTQKNGPDLLITARTLPQKNASTRVLEKNGFVFSGNVEDPEDGPVWEWNLK
ncbi:MAG: GNAT family N-acetyltransferase [Candidatus Omnitrophica bacterium]|nr:GNAT family N-acetyltransferase [Candidatus Omnitrophota bacterium]